MIDHTALQVADLSRSKRFYEPVLATLGHVPRRDFGDAVGYGKATPGPFDDPAGEFWLIAGTPLVPRVHIAFRAHSRESVDAFHRAALAAGGTDNGAPGIRLVYHPHYYACFVLDPDGYNVEAVCHAPPG